MKYTPALAMTAMIASVGLATAASAGPVWRANHPWRAHDNARLAHQNSRIRHGVQDGQLSRAEAHTLRADDHSIRAEERADASVNGTHLTRQDQRQIRAQENANSRDIRAARHGN